MDWTAQFDSYCERVDLTFWSEPVNAVTNLAFILAALVMWRRTRGDRPAHLLCAILFAIGVGSFLLHTFATAWASLADTAPIGIFILVYLYLVNRDMVGLRPPQAVMMTAGFVPFAAVMVPLLNALPFFHISNFYWTVPILLLGYGFFLRPRAPLTTRGLWQGAALLAVSISIRSLDEILCPVWPLGTHFVWHSLNGLMLAYMIHVYHQHILAGGKTPR